ncbi:MEDS domain-containing protein [Blastococcus sp. TF02A-26]|uniref:MEDS domain-containing protein n=1 Tax=Blastococcus sp. TF02A-26 TaxID=2250577 RepID=UPI000DEADE7C|nr:MEDS domain-containing protein [Blastococcus sp. TF02A-26]RBY83303.1 anti-anti-sigma factor [Blastococcus sp. TF02A-26]
MSAPRHLGSPTGLRPGDHACWTYADPAELAAAVLPYLDEGRRRGEQLLLVGESRAVLVEALAGLPDRDRLLESGQLEVRTTAEGYATDTAFSPAEQVEHYRELTRAAVDRGRTGLRVAADVSPLARQDLHHLYAYEQAADVLMGEVPMTALCLYDASLGVDVLGPVVVLHPDQHHGRRPPLAHLSGRGRSLALRGEVDLTEAAHVARALLDVAGSRPGVLDLDLTDLTFLDVAGARALARTVAELAGRGVVVRLVGAQRSPARCLALFGLNAEPA